MTLHEIQSHLQSILSKVTSAIEALAPAIEVLDPAAAPVIEVTEEVGNAVEALVDAATEGAQTPSAINV